MAKHEAQAITGITEPHQAHRNPAHLSGSNTSAVDCFTLHKWPKNDESLTYDWNSEAEVQIPITEAQKTQLSQWSLRNQRESPLLRLPSELRNEIYQYVLGGHTYDLPMESGGQPGTQLPERPMDLSLPLACRQTYLEALPIIYSHNTFAFEYGYDMEMFCAQRKSSEVRCIRNIEMIIDDPIRHNDHLFQLKVFSFLCLLPAIRRIDLVFDKRADQMFGGADTETWPELATFIQNLVPGIQITMRSDGRRMRIFWRHDEK